MSVTPRSEPADARRPVPPANHRLVALRILIATAVTMLGDLRTLHPSVVSGRLEHDLRRELEQLAQDLGSALTATDLRAAVAVRTACAHLATRAYEDAYLAVVTAQGLLPPPDQPST